MHRLSFAAVAMFAVACGKRSFVAEEASTASSSASVTSPEFEEPRSPAPAAPKDDEPEAPPPSPLATTCNGVSLVLTSTGQDRNGVNVALELRNAAAAHVPLMLPGDGSILGRRNPTVTFELSPNDVVKSAGCGNMNAMNARELVFLAPGSRTELLGVYPPRPSKPGEYSLRATYQNDPTTDRLGDNMPGPKTDKLVARVRKTLRCTLVSNSVKFTWTEPEKVKGACNCQLGDPLCSCP